MDRSMIGMCGAYCGVCEWKPKTSCPGCQSAKGELFWGRCAVAVCAASKALEHCGPCSELPCATLQGYFDDPEHGDRGQRLANLRAWSKGESTYLPLIPLNARNTP